MSKLEKKKLKLQERIQYLESELRLALTKKTSDTKEIDVAGHSRKIADLRKEFSNLK
jgi:predicted  nucleic acid-binding Zn-ribbon protein